MVVEKLFNWIIEGLMRALFELQTRTVRPALLIDKPSSYDGIQAGFSTNMELFPYLFAITFLVGVVSYPFAEEDITVEYLILQMIKVLLFVGLITVILDYSVELSNGLIQFLWPKGALNDLTVNFNQTLQGMAAGGVIVIFAIVLASISAITWVIFFLALHLREFMVISTFLLSPIYGAFLFINFGPFKVASRFPKVMIRLTAYLLIAGVMAAGFMQVGIAMSGSLDDTDGNQIDYQLDNETIWVKDSIEDKTAARWIPGVERSSSNITERWDRLESEPGLQGFALPDNVDRGSVVNKIVSGVKEFFGLNDTDGQDNNEGEQNENNQNDENSDQSGDNQDSGDSGEDDTDDTQDEGDDEEIADPDPFVLDRAYTSCLLSLENPSLLASNNMGGVQAEFPWFPEKQKYAETIRAWVNGEADGMSGEPRPDNVVEYCVVPLVYDGLGPATESDDIVRQSPIALSEAIAECEPDAGRVAQLGDLGPGPGIDYGDEVSTGEGKQSQTTKTFIENNRECVEKHEEEAVAGSLEEWREDPTLIHYWKDDLGREDKGAIESVVDGVTGGIKGVGEFAFSLVPGSGVINEAKNVFKGDENTFTVHPDAAIQQCAVGEQQFTCRPGATVVNTFKQFMIWFMSIIAPIIIIFYAGMIAMRPGTMMMGGMGAATAAGGGSPSGGGGGGPGSKGSELRNEASPALGRSDPINTNTASDHTAVDTSENATVNPMTMTGGVRDPSPVKPNKSRVKQISEGATSRAISGGKEIARQGLQSSPRSWASSLKNHFKENPIGEPPVDEPETARGVLDEVGDFDDLETVSAADIQGEDIESGTAVNMEGPVRFYEYDVAGSADASPQNDISIEDGPNLEQAGVFVGRDSNGVLHQTPVEVTDTKAAGLENGEWYDVNGAVAREPVSDIDGWNGDYKSVEVARNSHLNKVQSGTLNKVNSSGTQQRTSQSNTSSSSGVNTGSNTNQTKAQGPGRQSEGQPGGQSGGQSQSQGAGSHDHTQNAATSGGPTNPSDEDAVEVSQEAVEFYEEHGDMSHIAHDADAEGAADVTQEELSALDDPDVNTVVGENSVSENEVNDISQQSTEEPQVDEKTENEVEADEKPEENMKGNGPVSGVKDGEEEMESAEEVDESGGVVDSKMPNSAENIDGSEEEMDSEVAGAEEIDDTEENTDSELSDSAGRVDGSEEEIDPEMAGVDEINDAEGEVDSEIPDSAQNMDGEEEIDTEMPDTEKETEPNNLNSLNIEETDSVSTDSQGRAVPPEPEEPMDQSQEIEPVREIHKTPGTWGDSGAGQSQTENNSSQNQSSGSEGANSQNVKNIGESEANERPEPPEHFDGDADK
jgi:hypothetical protein